MNCFRRFAITIALTVTVSATLTGCGGGGGANVKPSQGGGTPVTNYNTDHLIAIGADQAHKAGATGSGITIGMVDSGILITHDEFDGGSRVLPGYNVVDNNTDVSDTSNIGHGTGTSSLAAGTNVGVAPAASILPVRVTDASGNLPAGTPYTCGTSTTYACGDIAKGVDYAIQHGARVVNVSASFVNLDDNAKVLNAAGAADKLVIVAAGNDGSASPESAGLLNSGNLVPLTQAAIDRFLIVGAIDSNNQIASFSNRAGTAMDRYLVAPGVGISIATNTGNSDYASGSGTSFSTPLVSGAAALVWAADPSLTGKQVADILLQTAKDLGAPGVDDVYGYGELDVAAAINPVGVLSVPQGSTASGPSLLAVDTSLNLGPAFGDALNNVSTLQSVVALDKFQRPYTVDLSKTITSAYQRVDLRSRMAAFLDDQNHLSAQIGNTRVEGYLTRPHTPVDISAFAANYPVHNAWGRQTVSFTSKIGGLPVQYDFGMNLAQFADSVSQVSDLDWLSSSNGNPYLGLANSNVQSLTVGGGIGHGLSLHADFAGGQHDLGAGSLHTGSAVRMGAIDLDYTLNRLDMRFNVGQTREHGSILGSSGDGATPTDMLSVTTMVDVSSKLDVTRDTSVVGTYRFGLTNVQNADTGLFRNWSGIHSNAMNLGLVSHNLLSRDDAFGIQYSRPLRVNSGTVQVNVPVARDLAHNIYRTEQQANLEPSGTEQDLELAYRTPTSTTSSLGLNLLYQVEPGHVVNAPPQTTAMVTFATGF